MNDHTPPERDDRRATREVLAFRAELRRVWNRAGAPDPRDMAKATGLPAMLFQGPIVIGDNLPDLDEVTALLRATGEIAAIPRWERRWHHLHQQREQARYTRLLGGLHGQLVVSSTALRAAIVATTAHEFNQALGMARRDADLSLRDVAKLTGGRLSKSTVQRMELRSTLPPRGETVRTYLRACRVGEPELRLWTARLDYLRAREHLAVPNTEELASPEEGEDGTEAAGLDAAGAPASQHWSRRLITRALIVLLLTGLPAILLTTSDQSLVLQWITVFFAGASMAIAAGFAYRTRATHARLDAKMRALRSIPRDPDDDSRGTDTQRRASGHLDETEVRKLIKTLGPQEAA